VDQYLNIKLDDIMVLDDIKYPHLVCSFGINMDIEGREGVELSADAGLSSFSG